MIKKIISITLCCIITLSLSVSGAAAADLEVTDFLKTAEILSSASQDKDAVATRGDFAIIAAKLYGLENYIPQSTTGGYVDVPTDSVYFNSVELLRELGVISGTGNGLFEPDEPITVEAASKILINIMGYGHMAVNNNYSVVANRKKLLNGVKVGTNGTLTFENVYMMIYNTLEADVSDSNSFDGIADKRGDDIFMSKRLGIYKAEGVVTDNGITSLYGEPSVDEGNLVIDGDKFVNDSGTSDIVGYDVTAYYKHDKSSNKDKIIYIYTDSKSLTISADKLVDYDKSARTYHYYDSDEATKSSNARIAANYKIIYNGRLFSEDTALSGFEYTLDEMMIPENGYVTLIDTDGNNSYDIISIWNFKNYLVSAVDSENYTIYGDSDYTPGNINLKSAEDSIRVIGSAGTVVNFSQVRVGDVASVAMSADGKHADIRMSVKTVNAYIEYEDNSVYKTESGSYYMSSEYRTYKEKNTISMLGKEGLMYLAFDDSIVCVKNAKHTDKIYARLIAVGKADSLGAKAEAKVVTQGNALSTYQIADNVKMDGKKYKSGDSQKIVDYLNNGFTAEGDFLGLILIGLNSANEINYIDTPYFESTGNPNSAYESDDSLHVINGAERALSQCFYGSNYAFDGNFYASNSSTLLAIGDTAKNPEDDTVFTNVTDKTNVADITSLSAEYIGFSMTADSCVADVVVRIREHTLSSFDKSLQSYVVLGIRDCLNSHGETVKKITVTDGKVVKDYMTETEDTLVCACGSDFCSKAPIVVEKGDIVRFYLNSAGVIPYAGIFVMYDKSTDTQWGFYREASHNGTPQAPTRKEIEMNAFNNGYIVLKGQLLSTEGEFSYWNFDYFPFRRYDTYRGETHRTYSGSDIKKYLAMNNAYVIEVDLQRETFKNLLTSDIVPGSGKTYFLLIKTGMPYCIVSYDE